jgi:hypothetical protein
VCQSETASEMLSLFVGERCLALLELLSAAWSEELRDDDVIALSKGVS